MVDRLFQEWWPILEKTVKTELSPGTLLLIQENQPKSFQFQLSMKEQTVCTLTAAGHSASVLHLIPPSNSTWLQRWYPPLTQCLSNQLSSGACSHYVCPVGRLWFLIGIFPQHWINLRITDTQTQTGGDPDDWDKVKRTHLWKQSYKTRVAMRMDEMWLQSVS